MAGVRATTDGFEVTSEDAASGERFTMACARFVNAAGLHASELAGAIEGLDPQYVPQTRYARGNYYSLPGKPAFSRLVYPVPEPGGLGVHLTLDLGGGMRFGPDVDWIELFNTTAAPIDIGGWFISDKAVNLMQYQIPPGKYRSPEG